MNALVLKYNVPGPRYTSYPTVPFWKNNPLQVTDWVNVLAKNAAFFQDDSLSLYVHLPYCESLCTFCGCHKHITKNHSYEGPYINTLKKEWDLYQAFLPQTTRIKALHFGGGTPTFFAPSQLISLVTYLFQQDQVDPTEVELSFEAHPNNTTSAHLEELYEFGFRRLSLGIQSYDPEVQRAIHRIQAFEQVESVHQKAKKIGYTSISHDLVYGLPKQHMEDLIETIRLTLLLKPDRISLYSYAHVPWVKGTGQRGYDENDLPNASEKQALYAKAKELLLAAGYHEIGMDHFALPHDELAIAQKNKTLFRNFMGYTTQQTNTLIGLGMSAISDAWFGFAQNEKTVSDYTKLVNEGVLPIFRGHILTEDELLIRRYILDVMCQFETNLNPAYPEMNTGIIDRLAELASDGLVEINKLQIRVPEKGIPFVRNVCMAFDLDLVNNNSNQSLFSKTI